MNRKRTDVFFKHLFRLVSLVSVLALGAILFFVFAQGIIPFFASSASTIRLVPQNIGELSVNGIIYTDHSGFIHLPKNVTSISVRFSSASFFDFGDEEDWDWGGDEEDWDWGDDEEDWDWDWGDEENAGFGAEEDMTGELDDIWDEPAAETVEIVIDHEEKDPEKKITFINSTGEASYPEAYVWTVSWPGMIAAMDKKIHIILPEPPYNPVHFLAGLIWQPVREKNEPGYRAVQEG